METNISVGGTVVNRSHLWERIFVPKFGNGKPKYGNALQRFKVQNRELQRLQSSKPRINPLDGILKFTNDVCQFKNCLFYVKNWSICSSFRVISTRSGKYNAVSRESVVPNFGNAISRLRR